MFKPSKLLKTQYDKANKYYWDGELPDDVSVGWNSELTKEALGMTVIVEDEETNHRIIQIHLHTDIKHLKGVWLMTLLHECCHVKLHPYMKHGRKFNEEMLRLAGRHAFYGLW